MKKAKNALSALKVTARAMLATVVVFTLLLGAGRLETMAETDLTTVYHLYIDNNYIGTLSERTGIDSLIDKKTEDMQEKYQEVDVEVGDNLSLITEQVFPSFSTASTSAVLEKLENELSVSAKAYALVINDKETAFLKDEESAKEVIKRLKLEHVAEQELVELSERKEVPKEGLPHLEDKESRLLDVRLTEKVTFSEAKVNPSNILTVDEAVKLFKKGTLEEKKYVVQSGDVLGTIANNHDLTLEELLDLNRQYHEDSVLKPGDELVVTYHQPLAKVIVEKEVYKEEVVPYEKEVIEDPSMFKGDVKVKQKGKDGMNGVTYKLIEENGTVIEKEELASTVITQPVKEMILKGTKVVPSRGTGEFVWPANGGYISSGMGHRWGKMHKGIDIARPAERTIKAVDNGKVISAGYDGGYGNKVVIDHGNGYRTVYAHLDSISVDTGQTVPRGEKIGIMGSTGDSTGIHLHFEVYKNGKLIDPQDVLS